VAVVRLRLFAAAREAAGRAEATFEAATLREVEDQARRVYGEVFVRVLETSRIWVNGDEPVAGPDTVLEDGDEVVVLPPVSGG
jgi:molybdopterin synthase sulfur carrier subunit